MIAQRSIDPARAAAGAKPLESRPNEPATEGDPSDPDRFRYVSALSTALSDGARRAQRPRDPKATPRLLLPGKPDAAGDRAAAGEASLQRIAEATANPRQASSAAWNDLCAASSI